ncbi:hypothetical protein LY78DRAFT_652357 [Colletotrichum sublineola]|nr:hypothetical protein LY78DRAFT_652357 [Colletotrichum sublineola]
MAMEQVPAVLVVMGLPQQSLISHVLGFQPLHNMALPATLLPLEHGCKALFERDRGVQGLYPHLLASSAWMYSVARRQAYVML